MQSFACSPWPVLAAIMRSLGRGWFSVETSVSPGGIVEGDRERGDDLRVSLSVGLTCDPFARNFLA